MPERDSTLPPEMSPSRYIEKVSLLTGEVLDEAIEPRQLLVHHHRDYHVVDVQARRVMSRMVATSGDEEKARQRMKEARRLGHKTAAVLAKLVGQDDPTKISKALFGLKEREYYFRYKKHPVQSDTIEEKLEDLQRRVSEKLEQARRPDGRLELRVLLTGGTGFVGKEVMWQAAHDDDVAEVVVVIRPKVVRDRKTKEVVATLSPAERGERLLSQLWLDTPELRRKFRFVAGDVEEPDLGIEADEIARLESTITHVIHSAASVAFDDPYEASFRANVQGTLNALAFSHRLRQAEGSRFVAHLGIETSYIHGRQTRKKAREEEVVFPRNFYNNYYELTKAMASIETERFILEHGLPVVELCPAIVIGESRAGNNRGDTKVVNAPVNLFGRAQEALDTTSGNWVDRSKVAMLTRMAFIFPGDPTAQINLIPVDRVVQGILAALKKPQAVGRRIHLATDDRLSAEEMQQIIREELGADVRLAEPTLHRNVTLPLLSKVLGRFKQERLAHALEKLGDIFGTYSEWGQPVHEVGRDVELLGLSPERPDTEHAFRMLCRHNRWVQEFGKVRDLDEIARREKIWWQLITEFEGDLGFPVGALPAEEFQQVLEERLDCDRFSLRQAS